MRLPARTSAEAVIDFSNALERMSREGLREVALGLDDATVESYTCMDCGYKTNALQVIEEHQANQQRYHSWRQRYRRWRALRRKTGDPITISDVHFRPLDMP